MKDKIIEAMALGKAAADAAAADLSVENLWPRNRKYYTREASEYLDGLYAGGFVVAPAKQETLI